MSDVKWFSNPSDPLGGRRRGAVQPLVMLCSALALAAWLPPAVATGRTGQQVVESVCARCHATGANGAPRIGDAAAWIGRASQGLSSLTRHALDGIRKMPAHGGQPDLTDLEIARAVTYMVNASGGHWVEPASAADLSTERSGQEVVAARCVKCHGEGVGGAPKIGDRQAWVPRLSKGLERLVRSAIHGHGGMPPRGGEASLTDHEIRDAILYMFNPAVAHRPPPPAAHEAVPREARYGPNHRVAGGMHVFFGFMPAAALRKFPPGSPERRMHGGVPAEPGYYHVNVTLIDAARDTPVEGARVRLRLELPGLTRTTTDLEPMEVGGGSYGNYVRAERGKLYRLTLRVQRPGSGGVVETSIEHVFD